tara:strand:- start:441 stop:1226 length:786 start_codon:yes stop_codon:yes gene_type:complete
MKPAQFVKIDSHCHLTSDELIGDVDAIVERAKAAGVVKIININTDQKTLKRGLALKKKYADFIENTAASTPHDVEKLGESDFSVFERAARAGQLIAVGETGLDYYYEHSNREIQKKFLHRYLRLAKEVHLPVVFHCRGDEAFADLFSIAKEYLPFRAVLHCFTGDKAQAQVCIDYGWYISLSGIVTFKKSIDLRDVVKTIPHNKILIETDAPYLAPQSRRGSVNEPSFINEVLSTISSELVVSQLDFSKKVLQNTQDVFCC